MATVTLAPILNGWQGFTANGLPNNGGFIYTYQAGSSTPLATYTTSAGYAPNANPIQLGTDGRPPQEIWLLVGNAYKFVVTDSLLNVIATYDNITPNLNANNNLNDVLSAATSRTNLGAAASGANTDITSLDGLTSAIPDLAMGSKIQPFTGFVSSNILTGTLLATTLDYRNTTLTIGTVTTQANSTLTINVPATSNLGSATANGYQRIIFLVAYNAGAPVLCVANSAGGLLLDETNVISPTTIGASSNSNNVVYSASTVAANSPYRVVGFGYFQFTTSTGWNGAILTQGAGGMALSSMAGIGNGQTCIDVSGSRTSGTTYYNTTGKPIFLSACYTCPTTSTNYATTLLVNGVTADFSGVYETSGGGNNYTKVSYLIPTNASYSVTATGASAALGFWSELR